MNAAVIIIITAFYSQVFILISGHIEFERMLSHTITSNSDFWNAWSNFLIQGNIITKYPSLFNNNDGQPSISKRCTLE